MPKEIERRDFNPNEIANGNSREQEIANFEKELLARPDVIHDIFTYYKFSATGVNFDTFKKYIVSVGDSLGIPTTEEEAEKEGWFEPDERGEIWFSIDNSTESPGCYNVNTKELTGAEDNGVSPHPGEVSHLFSPEIKSITPKEDKKYFTDIENKHFNPDTTVGSKFVIKNTTGYPGDKGYLPPHERLTNLEDLLVKAAIWRGNLQGDDRDILIKLGTQPEALSPDCRYLLVKTPGKLGIININKLSPETKVKVVRTKQGAPCNLVVEGKLEDTPFATIVIGKNTDPKATTKETIYTAHPGLPIKPATEDIWPEGSVVTVKDIKEKLGKDVYLNIEAKQNPAKL